MSSKSSLMVIALLYGLLISLNAALAPQASSGGGLVCTGITKVKGGTPIVEWGSLQGGLTLYLSCSGQDTAASNIVVLIGPFSCKVVSVDSQYITVETPSMFTLAGVSQVSLEVMINSGGVWNFGSSKTTETGKQAASASALNFQAREDTTPEIQRQVCEAVSGETVSSTICKSQTSSSSSVSTTIARDRTEETTTTTLSTYYESKIEKKVGEVKGGQKFTETKTSSCGKADYRKEAIGVSHDGSKYYTSKVVPVVKSCSKVRSSKGGEMEISGSGFSEDSEGIQVTVGGKKCTVKSATKDKVVVQVPAGTNDVDDDKNLKFSDGKGIKWAYVSWCGGTARSIKTKVTTEWNTFKSQNANHCHVCDYKTGFLKNIFKKQNYKASCQKIQEDEGQDVNKFAKFTYTCPRTGSYKFKVRGAASFLLDKCNVANKVDRDQMTTILETNTRRSVLDDSDTGDHISQAFSCTKGESHYFEMYYVEYAGARDFSFQIETPSIEVDDSTIAAQATNTGKLKVDDYRSQGKWDKQSGNSKRSTAPDQKSLPNAPTLSEQEKKDKFKRQAQYRYNHKRDSQRHTFTYTNDQEIHEFKLWGIQQATFRSGTYKKYFQINFRWVNPSNPSDVFDRNTANIYWDASTADIQNAINNCIGGYGPTVVRIPLDMQGNELDVNTSVDLVYGYKWTVTYSAWITRRFIIKIPNQSLCSATVVQTPSEPIGGTYKIKFQDQYVTCEGLGTYDIPFNFDYTVIEKCFRYTFNSRDYHCSGGGRAYDGLWWQVKISDRRLSERYGYNLPLISIETDNMTGGKVGTKPGCKSEKISTGSENLVYEVGHEVVAHPTGTPSVVVTVGNVDSTVHVDSEVDLAIDDSKVPILKTFMESVDGLSMEIQNYANIGYTVTVFDVTVMYGRTPCVNHTIAWPNLSCKIEKNPDGTLQIEAGDHIPSIHIRNCGNVITDSTVNPKSYKPTMSYNYPPEGSKNGGTNVTIKGAAFPITLSAQLMIFLNELPCKVKQYNNVEIVLYTPPCTPANDFNSFWFTIVYNDKKSDCELGLPSCSHSPQPIGPVVTALNITDASPVLKTPMRIYGSNFNGTVKTNNRAYLDTPDGEQVYELSIVTVASNGTWMDVILPGGHNGHYFVRTRKLEIGDSNRDVPFEYRILIYSISPVSGSKHGGTVLTITGDNFSNQLKDNVVFLGDEDNIICHILTSSKSSLTCLTPTAPVSYVGAQLVEFYGRILEKATCQTSDLKCLFTYDDSLTPSLSDISGKTFLSATSYTLSGSKFSVGTSCQAVFVNADGDESYSTSCTVTSDTQVTFVTPYLLSGTYDFKIRISPAGDTETFTVKVPFSISSCTPNQGSQGGVEVTINGNGFNPSSVPTVQLYTGTTLVGTCFVSSYTASTITCRTPRTVQNGVALTFTIIQDGKTCTSSTVTFTPKASLTFSVSTSDTLTLVGTPNAFSITLGVSSTAGTFTAYLELQDVEAALTRISSTGVTVSGSNLVISFSNVGAGNYLLFVNHDTFGFAYFNNLAHQNIQVALVSVAIPAVAQSSYAGGKEVTITGKGFQSVDIDRNIVKVCGFAAEVTAASFGSLTFKTPFVSGDQTNTAYQVKRVGSNYLSDYNLYKKKQYSLIDSSGAGTWAVLDNNVGTYYSSKSVPCYIGYDFGADIKAEVSQIRYEARYFKDEKAIVGGIFEASNDGINWDSLFTVPAAVARCCNIWYPKTRCDSKGKNCFTEVYRMFRFRHNNGGTQSNCELASFTLYGWKYYKVSLPVDIQNCNIEVDVEGYVQTLTNKVVYKASLTGIVEGVSPQWGTIVGGTQVVFSGKGFSTVIADYDVKIDGVTCVVNQAGELGFQCRTGAYKGLRKAMKSDIQIYIKGNKVIINDNCNTMFIYGLPFSQTYSWGNEIPPRKGDTVYVPPGQTLIVDVSTEVLFAVIIEGGIYFSDNYGINFHSYYFLIQGGEAMAGCKTNPRVNKLNIVQYGNYFTKPLPEFGNKVIGCYKCKMQFYGQEKAPNWTYLAKDVKKGQKILYLVEPVNWAWKDWIAIAATDLNPDHAEHRYITCISDDKMEIILDSPLLYDHTAYTESINGQDYQLSAEVAILSRFITFKQGEGFGGHNHGAHFMVYGSCDHGTSVQLGNVEFYQFGQERMVGRHPIYFRQNGECEGSYVVGSSIWQSNSNGIVVESTNSLLLENNVIYRSQGHAIILGQGIEVRNTLSRNLVISTFQTWKQSRTDVNPAAFYITNPNNDLLGNHAAGGSFQGYFLEFLDKADAQPSICPSGVALGKFDDNIAHDQKYYGLRVWFLAGRTNPCGAIRNDRKANPWLDNPSIKSTLTNFTAWRLGKIGVLGDHIGNTEFNQFTIIDFNLTGIQINEANYTYEPAMVSSLTLVAQSPTASRAFFTDAQVKAVNQTGVVTPRTDGFSAEGIFFVNFKAGTYLIQSCAGCDNYWTSVQGGKQSSFAGLDYENCDDAQTINWFRYRREIYLDVDGSLSKRSSKYIYGSPVYLTPYQAYFDQIKECKRDSSASLNDTVLCIGTKLVKFQIYAPTFKNAFTAQELRPFAMTDALPIASAPVTSFGSQVMMAVGSGDGTNSFVTVLATNYMYNMHWRYGIDFQHILITSSRYYNDANDKNIIIRFNHTEPRELWEIYDVVGGSLQNMTVASADSSTFFSGNSVVGTCSFGDYWHDDVNSDLYVCLSGQRNFYDGVDINAIYCREHCPKPGFGGSCDQEMFVRKFSDESNWLENALVRPPGQSNWQTGVPQEGWDVWIPPCWNMTFNVRWFRFNLLLIDGLLHFDETFAQQDMYAKNIWVRGGGLYAGQALFPYKSKLNIWLEGGYDSEYFVIDSILDAGNKVLFVTGELKLYGIIPGSISSYLVETAIAGAKLLKVASTTDWKVGDTIVLSATGLIENSYEIVTIAALAAKTGYTEVTLNEKLVYTHYGSTKITVSGQTTVPGETNIDASFGGDLDMRTRVGYSTRNIKIIGANSTTWGAKLNIYTWNVGVDTPGVSTPFSQAGSAVIRGVEIINVGQGDSLRAGLDLRFSKSGTVSTFYGNVVRDCKGICANVISSKNMEFDSNIFVQGKKYLVQIQQSTNIKFVNNLLIGCGSRSMPASNIWDETAAFAMYEAYSPLTDSVIIQNNFVSGSSGIGMLLPFVPCDLKASSQISGNTISNAKYWGVGLNQNGATCQWAGKFAIFHCGDGVNFNVFAPSIKLSEIRIAETQMGIHLRHSWKDETIWSYMENVYITAVARPTCTNCYTGALATTCGTQYAVKLLLAATDKGKLFPILQDPNTFDEILYEEVFDASMFLTNVVFENFKATYSTPLTACKNNRVFVNHVNASDATAGTYLTNTQCKNCDSNQLVQFLNPNPKWIGWEGGCGDFQCTGMNNILIYDTDGKFFAAGGSAAAISNNAAVGAGLGCTKKTNWNGYQCSGNKLAVLQFQSTAADARKRFVSPVTVSNGKFTNKLNTWREWNYEGATPLNWRPQRFWSLINLGDTYNITYYSQNPEKLQNKIQSRSISDETGYIIQKLWYQTAHELQVIANGEVVKPYRADLNEDLNSHSSTCGANNYFYQNNTIHFVQTVSKCDISVVQVNSVRVMAKLTMTMQDFLDNNLDTNFIDRVSAYLNIPTNKLKILGLQGTSPVANGNLRNLEATQVIVIFSISGSSPEDTANPAAQAAQLQAQVDQLKAAMEAGQIDLNGASVVSFESQTLVDDGKGNLSTKPKTVTESGSEQTPISASSSNLTLILVLSGVIIGIALLVTAAYIVWKKKQEYVKVFPQAQVNSDGADNIKESGVFDPQQKKGSDGENQSQIGDNISHASHMRLATIDNNGGEGVSANKLN